MRSSAQYRHSLKLLTFQPTTTLQRCKLIYAFEGGLRGFGGTAACTILISSRTMSVQSREIRLSFLKNIAYYTPSHPQKQAVQKFSLRAPDIRNLQHRIATYTQNSADAIRIQPGNLWTVISNFLLHLIIPSDIRPTAAAFNFILKFCLCRQIRHQFRGEQSFTFRHDGILHLRLVYFRTKKYADRLFIGWLAI